MKKNEFEYLRIEKIQHLSNSIHDIEDTLNSLCSLDQKYIEKNLDFFKEFYGEEFCQLVMLVGKFNPKTINLSKVIFDYYFRSVH